MNRLWTSLRNRWIWSLPLVLAASNYSALSLAAQGETTVTDEFGDVVVTPAPEGTPPAERFGAGTPPLFGGGGGMGGGGMGGMGGGGMGGMGGGGGFGYMSPPVVAWIKPEGEKPDWLVRGEKAVGAQEEIRAKLNKLAEYQFEALSLDEVCKTIAAEHGIQIDIDAAGLEELGMTADLPITLSGNGSLRSLLHRMLEDMDLSYLVHEDGLEITTSDKAIRCGRVRAYNLAYVANDSSLGVSILSAIEGMVQPDAWRSNGGEASCDLIGSVLLVKASERMHEEIQNVLAQLNAFRADDEE